jgi:hypothetical protein
MTDRKNITKKKNNPKSELMFLYKTKKIPGRNKTATAIKDLLVFFIIFF